MILCEVSAVSSGLLRIPKTPILGAQIPEQRNFNGASGWMRRIHDLIGLSRNQ
jgi:hypothetical protein